MYVRDTYGSFGYEDDAMLVVRNRGVLRQAYPTKPLVCVQAGRHTS